MSSGGANTYRVGDFVYFDDPNSPDSPYQIRRIDELNRTTAGVEARVVLYMRRRDVPFSLLRIADNASRKFDNYYEVDKKKPENFNSRGFVVANGEPNKEPEETEEGKPVEKKEEPIDTSVIDWGDGGLPLGAETLTEDERRQLRQREVFLSRQSEIMPAHQIRGKCRVTLLSEVETCDGYLNADVDSFFYSLVFDPVNQTLLADKGAIRVGDKYQARMDGEEKEAEDIEPEQENGAKTEKVEPEDDEDEEENNALKIDEEAADGKSEVPKVEQEIERDILVYSPYNKLSDRDIDQYLIVARAVGTFARALDSSSSAKIPTLHMAAACASRDVTILHAMSLLHHANYDVGKAVSYMVPTANKEHYPLQIDKATGNQTQTLGGPLLCRDQMEEWSTPEANLFEEALEKVGKDFNDIRADYLPWKSIRDIVEYYYQFKASTRYCDRKKTKTAESETKLKQVYIPSYNKQTPSVIGTFNLSQTVSKSSVPCENCSTEESQNWYSWGGKGQTRLCQLCWFKWKKNGSIDRKHELDRFDKNRPPPPPPAAPTANGNEKEKMGLLAPLQKSVNPLATTNKHNLPQHKFMSNQTFMTAAQAAFDRGQITKEQMNALKINLGFGRQPTKPASKPNILYYTTIWRRAVKRILPKTALNTRKLGRRPFMTIDHEAIIKAVAVSETKTILKFARHLAGSKAERIQETEFTKVMCHLQHVMTAAAAAASTKRPSSSTSHTGEPTAKLSKAHFQPSTSSSSSYSLAFPTSTKSLEAVGNTLLAVHKAFSNGEPYYHNQAFEKRFTGIKPDTKWIEVKQHGLRFVTGSRLKTERRRIIHKNLVRRVSRQPYQYHPFLDPILSSLAPFFTSH